MNKLAFLSILTTTSLIAGGLAVTTIFAYANEPSNENSYSAVPFTWSFDDLWGQYENDIFENQNNSNANSNIAAANQNKNSNNGRHLFESKDQTEQIVKQYESTTGKTLTEAEKSQIIETIRTKEKTPEPIYQPDTDSNSSQQAVELVQQILSSETTEGSNNFNNSVAPIYETTQAIAPDSVDHPAIVPESQTAENDNSDLKQNESIVDPSPSLPDDSIIITTPLISHAIEDNIAAEAIVQNEEPVIIEKEDTRSASLFGEDGIIAQIISNPVLRTGIAALPILIIVLITGFIISRREENE